MLYNHVLPNNWISPVVYHLRCGGIMTWVTWSFWFCRTYYYSVPTSSSMATEAQLSLFIDCHRKLLAKERNAEIGRCSLLLSNCSPKLLEQKGLALLGLGIVGINVGLGGKTCDPVAQALNNTWYLISLKKFSLVELERPIAYHSTPIFPPHTLR